MSDGGESVLLSRAPNLILLSLQCSGLVYQSSIHENSGRALRPVPIGVAVIRVQRPDLTPALTSCTQV